MDPIVEAYHLRRTELRDPHLATRALLAGELAVARWLLHGVHTGDDAVVGDAIQMLEELTEHLTRYEEAARAAAEAEAAEAAAAEAAWAQAAAADEAAEDEALHDEPLRDEALQDEPLGDGEGDRATDDGEPEDEPEPPLSR